jgi:hypothetical protein
MAKLQEAFGAELTPEASQAFMRQDSNLQAFNAFFKGDGSGRMFVYFQPKFAEGEVRTEAIAVSCVCSVGCFFVVGALLLTRVLLFPLAPPSFSPHQPNPTTVMVRKCRPQAAHVV